MIPENATAQPRHKARSTQRANRVTKKEQLIRMLGSASGADITTISARLGWQTHTTRAALTGLRKAGYEVIAERSGQRKPARYRIFAAPAPAATSVTTATEPQGTAHAG